MNRAVFSALFFWGGLIIGYIALPISLFANNTAMALSTIGVASIASYVSPYIGTLIILPLIVWFSYVDVFGFSPWNYLLIITLVGLLTNSAIKKGGHRWSAFSIVFAVFLFISIIYVALIAFVHSDDGMQSLLKLPKLLAIFFFAITLAAALNTQKRIIASLLFFLATILVSSLVGIFQFFHIDAFWALRELLPIPPAVAQQIASQYRITGLAAYNIPLTYQLVIAAPVALSLVFYTQKKRIFWLFLTTFLVIIFVLFASLSRSAVAASIVGLTVTGFYLYGIKRFFKLFLIGAFFIGVGAMTPIILSGNNRFDRLTIKGNDISTFARLPAANIAIKIATENPFGVLPAALESYLLYYRSDFFASVRRSVEQNMIQRVADIPTFVEQTENLPIAPHNQFLNMLLYYGFPGLLIIFFFFYLLIAGNGYLCRKFRYSWMHIIAAGVNGSLVSYILHSSFHNNGPYFEDPLSWYLVGISIALYNQTKRIDRLVT